MRSAKSQHHAVFPGGHPSSTDRARRCLTSVIGREPVDSAWYGRWRRSQKANITRCSQAVIRPSTDRARRCLTSVIGREPVDSAWYGPKSQHHAVFPGGHPSKYRARRLLNFGDRTRTGGLSVHKANITRCSQAVTHPSTDRARRSLTSVIGREPVDSAWYGRWRRSHKANITRCSQAVTHPSTDRARRCLTSVIGREPVDSAWYGRWRRSHKANITRCSQAVTHPSTDRARRCLTSVIGREPVYSAWYGRWRRSHKANITRCSQAVTHPSTDRARRCLTSVIGREPVYSAWYGRWRCFAGGSARVDIIRILSHFMPLDHDVNHKRQPCLVPAFDFDSSLDPDSGSVQNSKRKLITKLDRNYPQKANITRCSQAVTHPSTDRARRCLTSVIGREPVDSAWYGRWRRSV
ncbi:hypothetical protein EVAR_54388_1 [Eumeta japonica]|uniref:Uncharacterized protein n=1 Tax=Eumeta variegata TaxID=151549 RepID=A0A4C1Y3V6_EUMVA|nr:hypothetical protein EVAR_54388_1 [Eumeta japonica]